MDGPSGVIGQGQGRVSILLMHGHLSLTVTRVEPLGATRWPLPKQTGYPRGASSLSVPAPVTESCTDFSTGNGEHTTANSLLFCGSVSRTPCGKMRVKAVSSADHVIRNTNVKSVHCTPETNILLYVNCTSFAERKKEKGIVSVLMQPDPMWNQHRLGRGPKSRLCNKMV